MHLVNWHRNSTFVHLKQATIAADQAVEDLIRPVLAPVDDALFVRDLVENKASGLEIGIRAAGAILPALSPLSRAAAKIEMPFGRAAAETIPTFRNLAPLDEIVPARRFPAQQVQRVGYTGKLEYVVLESGELVLGRSGHISLSQGADVLAAGEARFFQGAVKRIDNMSGHYRPVGDSARNAAEAAFNRSGFNATGRYVERKFP